VPRLAFLVAMLLSFSLPGYAQVNCGDNPKDIPTGVQNKLNPEIDLKVQLLTKIIGNVELKGAVESDRRTLYAQFEDVDKHSMDLYFSWIACQKIMNEKGLTTPQKLDMWMTIYRTLDKPEGHVFERSWRSPEIVHADSVGDNQTNYRCFSPDDNWRFVSETATAVEIESGENNGFPAQNEWRITKQTPENICLEVKSRPHVKYSHAAISAKLSVKEIPLK
jgi:hypothetical protein